MWRGDTSQGTIFEIGEAGTQSTPSVQGRGEQDNSRSAQQEDPEEGKKNSPISADHQQVKRTKPVKWNSELLLQGLDAREDK